MLSPLAGVSNLADNSNDNDGFRPVERPAEPDAHGEAALLLVESLLHGLIGRDVISYADAVEIVDVAAEIKADLAADFGHAPDASRRSLDMLATISSSLKPDA